MYVCKYIFLFCSRNNDNNAYFFHFFILFCQPLPRSPLPLFFFFVIFSGDEMYEEQGKLSSGVLVATVDAAAVM